MLGPARMTVAAAPAVLGACDLCATPGQHLSAAVVVTHGAGGAVQFASCERCTRAMRRVVAALGPVTVEAAPPGVVVAPPRAGGMAVTTMRELVMEYAIDVVARDGRSRRPYAWGEGRADGTWVGWLEFVDPAGGPVARTGQETSQPDRGALAYWASGLQPSYLEGALARAH